MPLNLGFFSCQGESTTILKGCCSRNRNELQKLPQHGKSHADHANRKQPDPRDFILYGPIYIIFWKKQKFREWNQINRYRGWGGA